MDEINESTGIRKTNQFCTENLSKLMEISSAISFENAYLLFDEYGMAEEPN